MIFGGKKVIQSKMIVFTFIQEELSEILS